MYGNSIDSMRFELLEESDDPPVAAARIMDPKGKTIEAHDIAFREIIEGILVTIPNDSLWLSQLLYHLVNTHAEPEITHSLTRDDRMLGYLLLTCLYVE